LERSISTSNSKQVQNRNQRVQSSTNWHKNQWISLSLDTQDTLPWKNQLLSCALKKCISIEGVIHEQAIEEVGLGDGDRMY